MNLPCLFVELWCTDGQRTDDGWTDVVKHPAGYLAIKAAGQQWHSLETTWLQCIVHALAMLLSIYTWIIFQIIT